MSYFPANFLSDQYRLSVLHFPHSFLPNAQLYSFNRCDEVFRTEL